MNDGIEVALRFTCGRNGDLIEFASDVIDETKNSERLLTDLERRVHALAARRGVEPHIGSAPEARSDVDFPAAHADWDVLLERARVHVGDAQPDWSLDDLIESDRVSEIERLHGTVELRTRLDQIDVMAAVVAATVGTLLDFLVVKIPTGGIWGGSWQRGSELTLQLRRSAIRSDNWLSDLAKVPFDRVSDIPIDGFGPRSHRVQTFGHDPLLGLVLGTMDIVRGTLTGADPSGVAHVLDTGVPTSNVVAALARQLAHLLNDVLTPMGLPLPGWTALMTMPVDTSIGAVPEVARWMYLRGYGTWHFVSMATLPAAVEAVLRTYIGARRLADDAFDDMWQFEGERTLAQSMDEHPRYRTMSLLAHSVAALGNAGKLAVYGGNPLAINYVQWLTLARKVLGSLRAPGPTAGVTALANANAVRLNTGWAEFDLHTSVGR